METEKFRLFAANGTGKRTFVFLGQQMVNGREYGLITEAHAQLSVVGNCSSVCSGGGETAGGQGVVSSSMGWGQDRQYTGRENLEQFCTSES